MSDDMISQEEIDALLNGGAIPEAGGDAAPAGESEAAVEAPAADSSSSQLDDVLTDIEKDALGEIGNISMGSAATTLSVLLGHKVSITTPTVSVSTMSIIQEQYPMPYLIVEVGYTIGIDGNNVLAIQAQDASIIADLMMGGDGTNPDTEINEIAMSAVGESMNQMMGTVATSLSTMFNKKIDISPPKVNLIDLGNEDKVTELVGENEPVVRTSFRMEVDGLIDSEIMQILPVSVAKEMVESLTNSAQAEESEPEPAPAPAPAPAAAAPAPAPAMAAPPPQAAPAAPAMAAPPMGGYGMAMQPHVATNVPVQSAQFTPLNTQPVQVNDANIGLILDVPLQVTVELGRTKKSIKEILELTNGSIVELDKLAGEPVDIQVNGKFLAKGEVVVIDENFGVRITEIASPAERAAKLQ
ncbi:flagellar motor switch protein FliN/FliY [Selenomonas sp. GACV-9]|uniref:flagellar motor switch phosphatase FliY n=1 Tax=Selenomonas sp. GACV-9 TaxID=3158782 RepID=UPI0008EB0DA6|nr:flagellar motor switch protein FliN/FliY [Selenomonas ruminantium]